MGASQIIKVQTIKVLLGLFAAVSLAVLASCGSKRSEAYYDYKTKYVATELDGSYTVRSYGRGRNAPDALVQARKQAVYDIVFVGLEPSSKKNLESVKPLLLEVNAKEKYKDYFDVFFADNGPYEQFATVKERKWNTSKWARADGQSLCETTVCVYASKLKQKLIEDGILKK